MDGQLRHARVVAGGSPTNYFISAELVPADEEDDFPGDILTWAAASPDAADFVAVDEHAREASRWPASELDVSAPGAVESRGCVLTVRGEPADAECQAGFEDLCPD